MNFNAVVAEVARITKRPEKIVDIQREVNAAINFCCIEGNFARDRVENLYTINSTTYAQSLALSLFTRWRKFDYIRPSAKNCFLTRVEPSSIFTLQGKELCDVYYVAGDELKFKLKNLASQLIIAHFTYPPILTSSSAAFWLLDVSPFMIIDMAAAAIFSEVGNTTESNRLTTKANIAFISAQRDYKYGSNYG